MPVVYKNQGNTPVPPLFSLTVIQLRSRGHYRLSHAYGTGSTPSGTVGDIMATLWVERKVIIHCHFPPINGTYRSPFFFFFSPASFLKLYHITYTVAPKQGRYKLFPLRDGTFPRHHTCLCFWLSLVHIVSGSSTPVINTTKHQIHITCHDKLLLYIHYNILSISRNKLRAQPDDGLGTAPGIQSQLVSPFDRTQMRFHRNVY